MMTMELWCCQAVGVPLARILCLLGELSSCADKRLSHRRLQLIDFKRASLCLTIS